MIEHIQSSLSFLGSFTIFAFFNNHSQAASKIIFPFLYVFFYNKFHAQNEIFKP